MEDLVDDGASVRQSESSSRWTATEGSAAVFDHLDGPRTAYTHKRSPANLEFLRNHRGVSPKTVSKRDFQLTVFTWYLERVGVAAWKDVQASDLRTFLTAHLTERKPTTRLAYASTLRTFHRWAFLQGILERDLSVAAAAVRQYRLTGIPDTLTDDEVSALLQSVDRSTTIGKRDYAVLLLAARYGMRPGDIRQLRLDHIVIVPIEPVERRDDAGLIEIGHGPRVGLRGVPRTRGDRRLRAERFEPDDFVRVEGDAQHVVFRPDVTVGQRVPPDPVGRTDVGERHAQLLGRGRHVGKS